MVLRCMLLFQSKLRFKKRRSQEELVLCCTLLFQKHPRGIVNLTILLQMEDLKLFQVGLMSSLCLPFFSYSFVANKKYIYTWFFSELMFT